MTASQAARLATLGDHFTLRDATIPACLLPATEGLAPDFDGCVPVDVRVVGGQISAISAPGALPEDGGSVALGGAMVWPRLVDMHTHLDKGHIWPRTRNPDGSFAQAAAQVRADREAHWSGADVAARMDFALASAYAHGSGALRTHIDSYPGQVEISWPELRAARDRWAGRITVQAVSICPIDQLAGDFGTMLANTVADAGGVLGGVSRLTGGVHDALPDGFVDMLDHLFTLAMDRGLDIDLHVDESGEQGARGLLHIAQTAVRRGFSGRLVCGHCCSLAVQPEPFIQQTLAACKDAGLHVVSLPMCNMYLQDRMPGRTPRWRGITLLHEMAAAGIPVAIASDNTRDPFYAYGDLDAFEVFTQAVRIAHLDQPFGAWPSVITRTPADAMRLPEAGRIAPGGPADLVLLPARSLSEMLSRHQTRRVILQRGRVIDAELPDYAMLDGLLCPPGR